MKPAKFYQKVSRTLEGFWSNKESLKRRKTIRNLLGRRTISSTQQIPTEMSDRTSSG